MSWLHLLILSPFIYTILIPFLYKSFRRIHTGWFVLPLPLILFACLIKQVKIVAKGSVLSYVARWIPSLGIDFVVYLDGLSLMFGLIITGVGALVVLYSVFYLAKEREALHNFYVYLLLFMGAMLGLVFAENVLVLYLFWELTSISSFLLIAFWYQRKSSCYGAQKAFMITVAGGLAMLAGVLLLANITGTFSIQEMISQFSLIRNNPTFIAAMLLLLLGAFTKSAQFPFHIWLPDAMEAPTPISAYLHSATMVKAGIYLIARFTPIFGGSMLWFWLVTGVGLLTLFWASLVAIRQVDLKAMLAYSTVGQLGLIICLLGIGSAAFYYGTGVTEPLYTTAILAAIFHLVNHSTFKGCLFMVVGIIDHEAGTRDIRRLGGLLNIMPVTFTLAVIGGFAMAGLPPFNGFLSKEMFFTGVLNASQFGIFHLETWGKLIPVVAWIASIFTFVYCLIFVTRPFLGKHHPQKLEKITREAHLGMLISPALLASLVILFFFFPNDLAKYILYPTMAAILPGFTAIDSGLGPIRAWHGWTPELFMTLGVVTAGLVVYLAFRKWPRIIRLPSRLTWNALYDGILEKTEELSGRVTSSYMTGRLRDYLIYIFVGFIILTAGTMVINGSFAFDPTTNSPVLFYEFVLFFVVIGAAVLVLRGRTRLASVVALGVVGYLIAGFYVILRAPDLALTQIVVETVTTVLFLLCLYFLPRWNEEKPEGFRRFDFVIALGVGLTVTSLALAASGNNLFDSISWFYEQAYELAGAKNIVNAILVDFRGFDTMFEILVLCIGGLGVHTLIKLYLEGRKSK